VTQTEFSRQRLYEQAKGFEPPAKSGGREVSPACRSFIQRCLTYNHALRPDAHDLARHEWVARVGVSK